MKLIYKPIPTLLIQLGLLSSKMVMTPEVLDLPEGWFPYWGSFLLFLFFWFGILGFGQKAQDRIAKHLDSSIGLHLLLGSAFVSITLGFLAILIPIVWMKWVFFIFTAIGCSFFDLKKYPLKWKEPPITSILFILLLLSILFRTIESFLLSRHGDAFICYLTANRKLVATGSFQTFLDHPIYFFSSSWEYLYLWGNVFFYQGPHTGLAESQRFAQWCSSLIAHAGLIAVAYQLARLLKTSRTWALLVALSVSTVPVMRWMQNLPKNDYGIAFWGVGACLLLELTRENEEKNKNRTLFFAAGVLFGLMVIGKISSVSIGVPALVFLIWNRIAIQNWVILALGGLLGALPVLLRNFKLTENPFFPWLTGVFKKPVFGPSLQSSFHSVDPLSQGSVLKASFFLEPALEQYWIFGLLLFLVSIAFSRKLRTNSPKSTWIWGVGASLGCLFYATFLRPRTELRYLGPTLELTSLISVVALGILIHEMKKPFSRYLTGVFTIWVILASNISFFTLVQIFTEKYSRGTGTLLSHSGGVPKKWLRDHLQSPEKILSIGDNEEYYMSDYPFHEMSYVTPIDRALSFLSEAPAMIRFLKETGYAFIYDNRKQTPWGNLNSKSATLLSDYLKKFPESVVFQNENSIIYDLRRL